MNQNLFVEWIGWCGTILLAAIAIRTMFNGVARAYPWFFSYVLYVLSSSAVALWVHSTYPRAYPAFYWSSQAVALLLGISVSFEILRKAFTAYVGIRALALKAFRFLLCAVVLRVILMRQGNPSSLWIELERDVRVLQALMLISVTLLCLYFAIRPNGNLAAIMSGYGLFICFAIVNLALRSHVGVDFQNAWTLLQPVQYCLCELIWVAGLWKLAPRDVFQTPSDSSRTTVEATLRRLRGHLDMRSTT